MDRKLRVMNTLYATIGCQYYFTYDISYDLSYDTSHDMSYIIMYMSHWDVYDMSSDT